MELKEGMYVRTEEKGWIGKVISDWYEYKDEYVVDISFKDNNYNLYDLDDWIKNESYNLIDLIEEGDYVNEHKVLEKRNSSLKFGNDDLVLCYRLNHDTYYLHEEDIKSIVTKEQFESMSYKVGE